MIGLDTNVIIRYLTQDDPKQASQANQLIEAAAAKGETMFISLVTLCEVVWVLEGCFEVSKKQVLNMLSLILQIHQLRVEHEDVVRLAIADFEHSSRVDFSDCLIGRQNALQCSMTYTFDKNAAKKMPHLFNLIT